MAHEPGSQSCREIFARLSEYLDDELDPGICGRVAAHLDACPPCRVYLRSLRRTVSLLGTLDGPSLDDDLRRRILDDYRALAARLDRGESVD